MKEIINNNVNDDLLMLALIEGQAQTQEAADTALQVKLIESGMDEQRMALYMKGQITLNGEEGEILKLAQSALLGEKIAAVQPVGNIILQEQIAA